MNEMTYSNRPSTKSLAFTGERFLIPLFSGADYDQMIKSLESWVLWTRYEQFNAQDNIRRKMGGFMLMALRLRVPLNIPSDYTVKFLDPLYHICSEVPGPTRCAPSLTRSGLPTIENSSWIPY